MEITFVTTNEDKLRSFRRTLEASGVSVHHVELELAEPQVSSIPEIATHKAQQAYEMLRTPLVVQDTGFFMDAMPGFPGAFVKFVQNTLGVPGLLTLAHGKARTCRFEECLVYHDGTELHTFSTSVEGTLAEEARGKYKDDPTKLWSIFIAEGHTATLSELSENELRAWRATRPPNWAARFGEWYVARPLNTVPFERLQIGDRVISNLKNPGKITGLIPHDDNTVIMEWVNNPQPSHVYHCLADKVRYVGH